MLQYYFSLRQFRLIKWSFSYIVLCLTYTRGLILELSCSFPIDMQAHISSSSFHNLSEIELVMYLQNF